MTTPGRPFSQLKDVLRGLLIFAVLCAGLSAVCFAGFVVGSTDSKVDCIAAQLKALR